MALTRTEEPSAVVVLANATYEAIIDGWKLPKIDVAGLALDRQGYSIAPAAAAVHPAFAGTAAAPLFIRGFQWREDDNEGESWVPQGLSSSGDAFDDGRLAGRRWLVASWHDRDEARTRISFVDITNAGEIRY